MLYVFNTEMEWINNSKLNIDTNGWYGSWSKNGNLHEKEIIQFIYNRFKNCENFTFIDVGSNLGSYSFLVKEIPNSKCYSFEANPELVEIQKKNFKNHNLENNVIVENYAISDVSDETLILKVPEKTSSGLATLGENIIRFKKVVVEYEVKTKTIDDLSIDKVDYIKIDVEGWDLNVLKGCINTLKKFKPIIQIKFHEPNMRQCGIDPKELILFLEENNYKYELISQEELYCWHVDNSQIIFDVGTALGEMPAKWSSPDRLFHCFEPCPKFYNHLLQVFQNKKFIINNFAIDTNNSIKQFNQTVNKVSSSLLNLKNTSAWCPGSNDLDVNETYPVICLTLETYMKNNNINHIDFLKIDAQGNDLNVIKSLGSRIKDVKEVVLEVNISNINCYENESTKEDILDYMKLFDFELYKTQKQTYDKEENLYFKNKKYSCFLNLEL
jgi:FkbM family methyltransferase